MFSRVFKSFKPNRYTSAFFHNGPRYAFVFDPSYDLVSKLRQQSFSISHVDPINGYPSSFSRNLLHPFSNHVVSKYAIEYYNRAIPYYGEFPVQFFPSELYSVHSPPFCKTENQNTHSILIYPEQVLIKNIEPVHIPHMVRLCMDEEMLSSAIAKKNDFVKKIEGIILYFFCDVSTMDRVLTLFQWFDYCFRRNHVENVHYLFCTGNLKNGQSSTMMVHYGDYRIVLSQYITLKEVDEYVQHLIHYKP